MSGQALIEPFADVQPRVPGWFGKVVMLGDFAQRRLPQNFIAICDPWLSRCVSASRAQLGQSWLDVYLTAPLWRFAWAPGVVDEQWWFGVLMSSVDAVGRYFPLVICASDPSPPMSADALDTLSRWYAHTAQAALTTLQPDASLDSFEAHLACAPQWQFAANPAQRELQTLATRRRRVHQVGSTLLQCAQVLVGPALADAYSCHSLWLHVPGEHSADGESSLTVVPGLPDPDQFSLMLEGHW